MRIGGIPGEFRIERGSAADYNALRRFHYAAGRPATWAGVWAIRHRLSARTAQERIVAVAVLSWPVFNIATRRRLLGWQGPGTRDEARWLNAHVRTISRVIVHPSFRSLGLASRLVRRVWREADVPWIEALALMGQVHPLFEKAGMQRLGVERDGKVYLAKIDSGLQLPDARNVQ